MHTIGIAAPEHTDHWRMVVKQLNPLRYRLWNAHGSPVGRPDAWIAVLPCDASTSANQAWLRRLNSRALIITAHPERAARMTAAVRYPSLVVDPATAQARLAEHLGLLMYIMDGRGYVRAQGRSLSGDRSNGREPESIRQP